MKKVLALALGLAMIVALCACSGQTQTTQPTTQPTTQATEGQSTTQPVATEEPLVNLGSMVPVTTKPISMKMAVTVGAMNEDPASMWFFKYFEKQTNVHWEFTVIQSSAWSEKKPVMMATNDYPDVFFGQNFTPSEIMKYGVAGTFLPLNDYIKANGNMISQKLDMVDGSWQSITCADGKIYALPSLTLAYFFTDNRSWINKKWLDKVGLGVPTTVDEFYTALKAFKDQDANGNGDANDEIPWSQSWKDAGPRMMMLNAFGYATNGDMSNNIALDSGKNAVYIPLTSGYRDYLAFMNKCYNEKLLDQDVFSQDDVQLKAKGAEGIIGAAAYAAPFLLDPSGFKDWVAMALVAKQGDKPIAYKSSSVAVGKYMVTNKCQYPDAAVRWANLFYDPQFAYFIMYGPEAGTDQDPDGIGTRVKLDKDGYFADVETPGWDSKKMGLWDYYSLNHPVNSNFNFGIDDSYIFSQLYKTYFGDVPAMTAYYKNMVDTGEGNMNEAYWRYQNLTVEVPNTTTGYPTVYLSTEAQTKVDEMKTPLEDCVKAWEAKFITGAASLDKDFDTFLSEIKKLGADEYQQIFVDAYKSYQSNAK